MDDPVSSIVDDLNQSNQKSDLKVHEALDRLIPTKAGYEFRKQHGGIKMDYEETPELEEWEEEHFDQQFQKEQLWRQKKLQKMVAERTNQLTQEGFAKAAKKHGMSVEEFSKIVGTPLQSQEEQDYIQSHFLDSVTRYWDERARMAQNPMHRRRGPDGRFVSERNTGGGPNRDVVERAKESKDAEGVLEALLPDDHPIWRR